MKGTNIAVHSSADLKNPYISRCTVVGRSRNVIIRSTRTQLLGSVTVTTTIRHRYCFCVPMCMCMCMCVAQPCVMMMLRCSYTRSATAIIVIVLVGWIRVNKDGNQVLLLLSVVTLLRTVVGCFQWMDLFWFRLICSGDTDDDDIVLCKCECPRGVELIYVDGFWFCLSI